MSICWNRSIHWVADDLCGRLPCSKKPILGAAQTAPHILCLPTLSPRQFIVVSTKFIVVSIRLLIELLQNDTDAIRLCCCTNSLLLNPTKIKVVSFSCKANVIVHPYKLHESHISRSSVVCALNVLTDSCLTFN